MLLENDPSALPTTGLGDAELLCADASQPRRDAEVTRTRGDRQAALAALASAALTAGSLQALLGHASALVAGALDVDCCGVMKLGSGANSLGLRAGVGWRDGLVGNVTVEPGRESLSGFAVEQGEAVVVNDIRTETRFRVPRLLIENGVLSAAAVVIHARVGSPAAEPWGTLEVHSRPRRAFVADDLEFLQTVASTLGLAIEHSAAERRIAADALEAEHRAYERISQLLHDGPLQSLLAARQDLVKADRAGTANDRLVSRAREGVAEAIGELRDAVVALHPVTLERRGLSSVIEATAGFHAAAGGFGLSLDVVPATAGSRDPLVVWLAHELLGNVAKHAAASHVTLVLRRVGEDLVFEVTDNGRGMNRTRLTEAVDQGHIGLASIARRVDALGGHFTLTTKIGEGTSARVVLPGAASRPEEVTAYG